MITGVLSRERKRERSKKKGATLTGAEILFVPTSKAHKVFQRLSVMAHSIMCINIKA